MRHARHARYDNRLNGYRRRQVGMDAWGWSALGPWLSDRATLPVGRLFCVIAGGDRPPQQLNACDEQRSSIDLAEVESCRFDPLRR